MELTTKILKDKNVSIREFERLLNQAEAGHPVELTESSPEVTLLRELLTAEGVYWDSDGMDNDYAGRVFWSTDGACVVIVTE